MKKYSLIDKKKRRVVELEKLKRYIRKLKMQEEEWIVRNGNWFERIKEKF